MPGIDSLQGLDVPVSALPKDVRDGTDEDKKTYRAALGFERQLLTQLMQSLSSTADPQDDSGDSSDAGVQSYKQMLPDNMADAIVSGGGTGMAEDLYRALREQAGS